MKRKSKVFIVDDHTSVRSSLEALLTVQGYDVRTFPSATHFLVQHHPTQIGCVLINLTDANNGGRLLLKRLQESRSLLSIVIISGLFVTSLVDGNGFDSAEPVIKPYEASTLLTMVEDAISGSIRRRAKRARGRIS